MPTKILHYHARWVANRRAAFFLGKVCVRCGSTSKLEIDHADPTKKVSHAVWSWKETRRAEELAKCQILCRKCHRKKTAEESRQRLAGRPNTAQRAFTNEQIVEIRRRLEAGETHRAVGAMFGVSSTTIHRIRRFKSYRFPVKESK